MAPNPDEIAGNKSQEAGEISRGTFRQPVI